MDEAVAPNLISATAEQVFSLALVRLGFYPQMTQISADALAMRAAIQRSTTMKISTCDYLRSLRIVPSIARADFTTEDTENKDFRVFNS